MSGTSLLLFAGALLVTAGSPGPSVAALVARVMTRGARGVLPFLGAMWVGEALWLTCAVLGLAAVAHTFHEVFVILKWLGIGYLLYLAWRMWGAPVAEGSEELPDTTSPVKLFLAGLAVTIGNPKIMMFYIALLPTLVDLGGLTIEGWATLVGVMLVVLIGVDMFWVFLASKARLFLKSQRSRRIANRTSAGLMATAAVTIASR